MQNIIHEANLASENVVDLKALLQNCPPAFRAEVMGILVDQGFGFEETHPNLHLPSDILGAMGDLDDFRDHSAWNAFKLALQEANHLGILVDLRTLVFHTEYASA